MTGDDDFRPRPGRIRSNRSAKGIATLRKIRVAVERAGGQYGGRGAGGRSRFDGSASTFGRGRLALARGGPAGAARRQVVVKARVVRQTPGGALGAHIGYLQRDGVTRDGEPGRLFDARTDIADGPGFATRAADDRHHFRFIISPEDAVELSDLRTYARDLMRGVEADLVTPLDWVGVDHWNTARPHLHIVVRGRMEDGQDLVISRDYISRGVRERAEALAGIELGPPSPREREAAQLRDAGAQRWTRLDLRLERLADSERVVALGRGGAMRDPVERKPLIQRARALTRLGLAEAAGPGRWRLIEGLRGRLERLARSTEIAGRMEAASRERGLARAPERWVTAELSSVVTGRVIARGRDDELLGTGFAVIDGVDGRLHHLTVADAAASDPREGAIVRASPPSRGVHPMTVTLSDLDLAGQTTAAGATWLDRRLLDPAPPENAGGFADDLLQAREKRVDHLVSEGLAERRNGGVRFARNLLRALKAREIAAVTAEVSATTGLQYRPLAEGDAVNGVYRRRLDLSSGRFAMIDDGAGFSLVPWRPQLERNLGRTVSGVVGPGDDIAWRPPRGLGR